MAWTLLDSRTPRLGRRGDCSTPTAAVQPLDHFYQGWPLLMVLHDADNVAVGDRCVRPHQVVVRSLVPAGDVSQVELQSMRIPPLVTLPWNRIVPSPPFAATQVIEFLSWAPRTPSPSYEIVSITKVGD